MTAKVRILKGHGNGIGCIQGDWQRPGDCFGEMRHRMS
jgi:hypothetical protein